MKVIVADSCSLILLAKCNLLRVLTGIFPIIIPRAIFNEVVNRETIQRFPDAKIISQLISDRKVKVVDEKVSRQKLPVSLDNGEREALALAKQTPDAILATDDGKAIKACRYLGIRFIITPKIAVELFRLDAIGFDKVKSSIEKMRILGRYSPDIIADAILELEVIRNAKTNNC